MVKGAGIAKNTRFVGLDVHAETIAVAVAEGRAQIRSLGTIPSRAEAVHRLLGNPSELRACYEARPTGYALYWQVTASRAGHRRDQYRGRLLKWATATIFVPVGGFLELDLGSRMKTVAASGHANAARVAR